MVKKSKKGTKRKKQNSESERTSQAKTSRPRHSETTRDSLLVLPPEPTQREIKLREQCVDKTHKHGGPKLTLDRSLKIKTRNLIKEPDVPESTPEEISEG
jgi:hypothetical protein